MDDQPKPADTPVTAPTPTDEANLNKALDALQGLDSSEPTVTIEPVAQEAEPINQPPAPVIPPDPAPAPVSPIATPPVSEPAPMATSDIDAPELSPDPDAAADPAAVPLPSHKAVVMPSPSFDPTAPSTTSSPFDEAVAPSVPAPDAMATASAPVDQFTQATPLPPQKAGGSKPIIIAIAALIVIGGCVGVFFLSNSKKLSCEMSQSYMGMTMENKIEVNYGLFGENPTGLMANMSMDAPDENTAKQMYEFTKGSDSSETDIKTSYKLEGKTIYVTMEADKDYVKKALEEQNGDKVTGLDRDTVKKNLENSGFTCK